MKREEQTTDLEKNLRTALVIGSEKEIAKWEKKVSELGLEWAAVFQDGLVSNNSKWIYDHRHEGSIIDRVVVGKGIWE